MLNEIDLAAVDLNLLVVFEAVFREKHVAKAAAQLHITASAVSHGLGRLRRLFDDPLFLKTPKGVVPSARALELAPAIADILARVRGVIGAVESFDARASMRRFTLGMADATAATLVPALLGQLQRAAPRIDLGVHNMLPMAGVPALEARTIDVAVLGVDDIPPRCYAKVLFEEEFVIAARSGHPFLKSPSLKSFCAAQHLLVSSSGDAYGFVDAALEKQGLSRRVAITVPSFMLGLAALADTDLIAAVPKSLVDSQAARYGIASVKPPLALRRSQMHIIALKSVLQDAGVAWLFQQVEAAVTAALGGTRSRRQRSAT